MCLVVTLYGQATVATHKTHKLSSKYYGSNRVSKRIGQVAYKAELSQELLFNMSYFTAKTEAMPNSSMSNVKRGIVEIQPAFG